MTWTSRALASLAAAAALAVACGGSGASSSASPKSSPTPSPSKAALITGTIDACSLVKAADASTATGITMTSLSGTSGTGVCIYSGQTDTTSASVFVYAQEYPDTTTADAVSADQIAAAMNGQIGIADAKPVTGIGDKAVEYTATSASSTGSGIVIFVFKANVVMFIAVSPTNDATKVEALARIAVANLPQS
jgi:hypothetical protein